MDFEFSPEQRAFAEEVEQFLDEHDDPDVFDLTRENMAQIVDTPKRRAFMRQLGERGWLGLTWPKEYGGSEGEGVYEYLLNEALAARGGPQIGKGVGIIGKTLIKEASDFLKQEFLPQDPAQRRGVRGRLQRAQRGIRRGVDAAQGRARRARRQAGLDPQRPEDVDHLRALRRVVLARHAHRSRQQAPRHHAHARAARPARRHHQGHLDDGRRAHQRGVHRRRVRARRVRRRRGRTAASSTSRRRSTSSASRCSRSRRSSSASTCSSTTCAPTSRDGEPLRDDPVDPARDRAARHRRRGGARARPARGRGVDEGREGPGHAAADHRVVGVQAVRDRVLAPARERVDGHRRSGQRSCGCARSPTRRWRAGPSRRTATR